MVLAVSNHRPSPELMPTPHGLEFKAGAELRPPVAGVALAGQVQDFFREITDPGMLLAMGVGSIAFRAGQALGRGILSASLPAAVLGLASESLAFTGVARGYGRWLGRSETLTTPDWAGQWGATAFMLGALRLSGAGMMTLGRALHGDQLMASKTLLPLYRQMGMLGGILVGNGVLEGFASPADHLRRSLAYLVQFNAAGLLAQGMVGRYLAPVERALGAEPNVIAQGIFDPPLKALERFGLKLNPVGAAERPGKWSVLQMQSLGSDSPKQGVAPKAGSAPEGPDPRLRLKNQEEKINALMETWYRDFSDDRWVAEFLTAYGIPTHPLDITMFRRGYELGARRLERIQDIAWDLDEVQLHWALGPGDLFRGGSRGKQFPEFHNTPAELLNYTSFSSAEQIELPRLQKLWFQGVQRLFPSRMRQTLQFHPGIRAFLLGLHFVGRRPLTLCTTGSAGRLLILVNEDSALRRIFFGKLPTETVTMKEIRNNSNIYTREDLVKALRVLARGKDKFSFDADIQSYREKIAQNPQEGGKLKHPALSKLLGKRPFNVLIDDSNATFQTLSDLHDFAVLKPPSSRPTRTLNFAMGSAEGYLEKRADNYVEELAKALDNVWANQSRAIPPAQDLPDYPRRRFVIEIPWERYFLDYIKPGAELRWLGEQIAAAEKNAPPRSVGPYRMTGDGLRFTEPNRRVVLLGDSGGGRILTLAEEGHRPILMDWDATELDLNRKIFERLGQKKMEKTKGYRLPRAEWMRADWYETPLDGDAVEVFYPYSDTTIYTGSRGNYHSFARTFMEEALHTKLRPGGGTVYLLTEVSPLIRGMERVVREDPSLELMGMELDGQAPPIKGGHNATFGWRDERVSWILYRKKPR